MKAVVLYDSQYGNTEQIARTVAHVLQRHYAVQLISASDVSILTDRPDLLVVGSPTHRRRPTPAMLAALRALPDALIDRVATAVFDTRYKRPRFLTGAASLGIAKSLGRRGARVEIGAESFFVEDKEGPLLAGEIERAERWAYQVLYLVSPNPPGRRK
jgi:flavodoxin I